MGCVIWFRLGIALYAPTSMPIFLTRHAAAGTRGSLGHDNDLQRPLDAVGHDQAAGLIALLGERGVTEIYSSAATRCVDAVAPLAAHLDLQVVVEPALLEGQSATMALHLLRTLAQSKTTAVLCSHGDIIPDAIQTLAREGMIIVGQRAWAKGSTWELRTRGSDITEGRFLGPY